MNKTTPQDILNLIRARHNLPNLERVERTPEQEQEAHQRLKNVADVLRRIVWDEDKKEWYDPLEVRNDGPQ
jgi:hypothetical protein